MPRRRYLIAYDIADPRRLRQVCALMEEHGERLQYSVFLCDLTPAERAELETAVTHVMALANDSIVAIDLGATDNPTPIRVIGRPRPLPTQRPHDRLMRAVRSRPQPRAPLARRSDPIEPVTWDIQRTPATPVLRPPLAKRAIIPAHRAQNHEP